jgi:hypothetical protein
MWALQLAFRVEVDADSRMLGHLEPAIGWHRLIE